MNYLQRFAQMQIDTNPAPILQPDSDKPMVVFLDHQIKGAEPTGLEPSRDRSARCDSLSRNTSKLTGVKPSRGLSGGIFRTDQKFTDDFANFEPFALMPRSCEIFVDQHLGQLGIGGWNIFNGDQH